MDKHSSIVNKIIHFSHSLGLDACGASDEFIYLWKLYKTVNVQKVPIFQQLSALKLSFHIMDLIPFSGFLIQNHGDHHGSNLEKRGLNANYLKKCRK